MRKLKLAISAAVASVAIVTSSSAFACKVVGRAKNGEPLCMTTHVYKKGSPSWTDPTQWKKPAERCRAECLRDALKWGTSTQQAAFFKMCKENKGCV